MTDEQIWLLKFGRGWVEILQFPLLDDEEDDDDSLFYRLSSAGRLEINDDFSHVRLDIKE